MKKMLEVIKWVGTVCIIVAATFRAFEFHTADLVISILGAGLWGYASIAMKDKPLFVVNAFVVSILLFGVFK
jgi:hypothetical protein